MADVPTMTASGWPALTRATSALRSVASIGADSTLTLTTRSCLPLTPPLLLTRAMVSFVASHEGLAYEAPGPVVSQSSPMTIVSPDLLAESLLLHADTVAAAVRPARTLASRRIRRLSMATYQGQAEGPGACGA